jgi:hypothetical protein
MSFWKTVLVSLVVGMILGAIALVALKTTIYGAGVKVFEVKAPVERSFSFIADGEINECTKRDGAEFSEIDGEGLGQSSVFTWKDPLTKKTYRNKVAVVVYEPNQRIVLKYGNSSPPGEGMGGAMDTFIFTPGENGGTRIVFTSEGSFYLPMVLTSTPWGLRYIDKAGTKFMEDIAGCMTEKLGKK